jgi:hypothetical protein
LVCAKNKNQRFTEPFVGDKTFSVNKLHKSAFVCTALFFQGKQKGVFLSTLWHQVCDVV